VALPVEYAVLSNGTGEETPPRQVMAQNISWGGLLLVLTEPLPDNTTMTLRLHFPSATATPFTVDCDVRIVWTEIRTGVEKNEHRCGVLFTRIEETDLNFIRQFIQGQMER
jgi:c-di-GMP-binding flagellar brake protein YcgR